MRVRGVSAPSPKGPPAPASTEAPGPCSADPAVTVRSLRDTVSCGLPLAARTATCSLILHKASDWGPGVGTPGPENQERGLRERHVAAQNRALFAQQELPRLQLGIRGAVLALAPASREERAHVLGRQEAARSER